MANNDYWSFPVSFYFKVEFRGDTKIDEMAFKEVSGLNAELELESLQEGGVNNYTHQLPKVAKHGNLVLKRSIMPINKLNEIMLSKWIKKVFAGDYAAPIETQSILIHLLNAEGKTLHLWTCQNAYPVKLELEAFDSEKNSVAVETMEFTYTTIIRDK